MKLSYDIISVVQHYNGWSGILLLKKTNNYFNLLYTNSYIHGLKIYETKVIIVENFLSRWVSIFKCRKIFIRRIMNDITYRKKYIYIHLTPTPHICMYNLLPGYKGAYIKKIFSSNIENLKKCMNNPSYDEVLTQLHTLPTDVWGHYIDNHVWGEYTNIELYS